jgi:predicted TIM-barrel fold metal-dependent hydrolase
MIRMDRREFLAGPLGMAAAAKLSAQAGLSAPANSEWGSPVLDIHFHMRRDIEAELAHMDGAGVTRAVLLAPAMAEDRAKERVEKHPGRFVRFAAANVANPESVELLKKCVRNGAIGLGELKSQVACDGPEMRRVYAMAAEMGVPVLMHFQEVTQTGSQGTFNTGIQRLPAILKEFSKTTFIGHADAFWANISAEVPTDNAYPTGQIKPGGLTDRMLADYPNLYADLSANSGRNAMTRDPDFTAGFLARHQNKLMLGSDCGCRDGKGTGQMSPAAALKGKCVARETLTALKRHASPEAFRRIVWGNGVKLLKIKV